MAHRYYAATGAARASTGKGKDAAKRDDPGRAKSRQQTLAWLRADLALRTLQQATGKSEDHVEVRSVLPIWQKNDAFAEVREPKQLEKSPAVEREGWRKL